MMMGMTGAFSMLTILVLLVGVDCQNVLEGTGSVPDSLVRPNLSFNNGLVPLPPGGAGQEQQGPVADQVGAFPANEGRGGEENFQLRDPLGGPPSSIHVNSNAAEAMGEKGDSSGKTAKAKDGNNPQGNGNGNGKSRDSKKDKRQGGGRKLRFIIQDVDNKGTRGLLNNPVL